jgi:ABC-type polysaccharide/polyol phosphate transport system ATPase subunit
VATVILENVNVDFPIYGAQQRSLHKAIFKRATGGSIERDGRNQDRVTVKALSDISLTLHDGDRLGLIGHNGSGKSTLLKLIAGIYQPVSGHIKVDGRVTPLFDAMPGLDGEDSGYENIITSGMLIGMTREQIEAKIPEIEEFCELGEYLSLPVRTYSTGMTMRLGFALVTALDPGVLLMDEGFGTGDLRFAERAQERMNDFIGRSRIVVLASHSDATIRSMCNKAVMMESGRIVAIGPVDDICDQYADSVHSATQALIKSAVSEGVSVRDFPDNPEKPAVVRRIAVVDENRKPRHLSGIDDAVAIEIDYHLKRPIIVSVIVAVARDRVYIFQTHDTDLDKIMLRTRKAGFFRATVPLPRRLLTAGTYSVSVKVSIGNFGAGGEDSVNDAINFVLSEADQGPDVAIKGWARARGNFVIVEPKWTTQALDI